MEILLAILLVASIIFNFIFFDVLTKNQKFLLDQIEELKIILINKK